MGHDPVAAARASRLLTDTFSRVQSPWMITERVTHDLRKDAQELRDDPETLAAYLKFITMYTGEKHVKRRKTQLR